MRITTTDKLPDINIAGLNKILQIKPDVSTETHESQKEAREGEHVTYLHPEQNTKLKDYPKYEEVHVDHKSTFLHPAIKGKRDLIDWVMTMLGYPLVTVELRDNHYDAAIQNALYTYTKYANFPHKYMLKSSNEYVPGVGIDLSKENVVQVTEVQYGVDFSGWGTVLPWMINRTSTGNYGSGNLAGSFITYHNFVEFKKMAQRVLSTQPDWQYNIAAKRLVLIPEPRNMRPYSQPPYHSELWPYPELRGKPDPRWGVPMVLEVEIEPPLDELYSNEHVRRLTLAYCKILLGQIRGKYEGITLPGGGSVSKDIGAEGKEELDKTLENLRSETAGMPEVFFA
jgi:hypothetical protein